MVKLLVRIILIALIAVAASCQFGDEDAMDSYKGGGNPLFVAVADNNYSYVSQDGMIWVKGNNDVVDTSITYGNGLFIARGRGTDAISTSVDGINWTGYSLAQTGLPYSPNNIKYGNEKYIAGCYNLVYSSYDGIHWNYSGEVSLDYKLNRISYGNKIFFGVCFGATKSTRIYTSYSGSNWKKINFSYPVTEMHLDIVYGNTLFILVGYDSFAYSSTIRISKDSISWSNNVLYKSGTRFSSIAYGNGTFVAAGRTTSGGDKGVVYVSQNGFLWNGPINLPDTTSIWDIIYCKGLFIVVGQNGYISYSKDGYNWSGNAGPGGSITIRSITVRP